MSVRRRLVASAGALVAAVVAVPMLSVPGAFGAYTATVTNSRNAAGTASFFTCAGAATGLGATIAWPLDDAGVLGVAGAARDVSGASRTGLYTVGGVTYRQTGAACPRDLTSGQSFSIGLNGTSGYVGYATPFALTNTFSESLWFKTTTTTGGRLIGFGGSATAPSNENDRMVYMSNDGTLTFGVYPGAVRTVTSPRAYNDGAWHHVVATLGANGMVLYVDGAPVASNGSVTTAQTYSTNAMYLRVGYDNLNFWVNVPSSYYFQGSVRFADYFGTTLTAAQAAALYRAGV